MFKAANLQGFDTKKKMIIYNMKSQVKMYYGTVAFYINTNEAFDYFRPIHIFYFSKMILHFISNSVGSVLPSSLLNARYLIKCKLYQRNNYHYMTTFELKFKMGDYGGEWVNTVTSKSLSCRNFILENAIVYTFCCLSLPVICEMRCMIVQ